MEAEPFWMCYNKVLDHIQLCRERETGRVHESQSWCVSLSLQDNQERKQKTVTRVNTFVRKEKRMNATEIIKADCLFR